MRTLLLPCLLLLLTACGPDRSHPPAKPLGPEHYVIAPEDKPAATEHMRYAEPVVGKAGGLDIAVTTYRKPEGGPTIALFGVIHVADAPYFDAVQRELDTYDTVLYEGVKPENQSKAEWQASFKDGGGESSAMQQDIAGWFGLAFQLHVIDYTRENFVHADMSLEMFLEKGGGDLIPGLRKPERAPEDPAGDNPPEGEVSEGLAIGVGSEPSDHEAAERAGRVSSAVRSTWTAVKSFGDVALGKPGPMRSLARRMFASTLGSTDIGRALEMQPGFSDLILIQRNVVVMERLREVLANESAGDGSIAIFYGAAHMDDLEERLTDKLGYERVDGHWLRAWAIRPPLK